jgi:hypothetical protein
MGQQSERTSDDMKPIAPAVKENTSADSASLDSREATDPVAESEALSQSIWFSEDVKTQPAAKSDGSQTAGGDASVRSIKPAKEVQGDLTLTPIQSVLAAGATATENLESAKSQAATEPVKAGEALPAANPQAPKSTADVPKLQPDVPIASRADVPAADRTDVPTAARDEVPVAARADVPVITSDDSLADKVTPRQSVTDADIEKFRKAVLDADTNAPEASRALIDGRKQSLDLIAKFSAEVNGPQDVLQATSDQLKAQEIKQVKEYNEYLAPGTSRVDLGTALISRGDDASVREGERMLVEAVQTRPDLIFHPNFRAQVMDSYQQMAEFRKSNDLAPWRAEIPTGAPPVETSAWEDKTGDHFIKANDEFFKSGIKAALPEFQKAIEAADQTTAHNNSRLSKERLDLFVGGLQADRAIAQGQVTGESTMEMEKRRVDIWNKQINNYVEDAAGSTARMNVGVAMIASGDPEMLTKGNQQLLDALSKHPGMVYSPGLSTFGNEFSESLINAFIANAESVKPLDTTGGAKPDTPNPFIPRDEADIMAGYDPEKLSKTPLPLSNEEVQGYGWDKATDIALPIASLALMLYVGRSRYNSHQRNVAAREAMFELEPTDRSAAKQDIVTRESAKGEERLEIKGRAKDGQIVAKNLREGADTSASTKPPIDPPKDFNPGKNKFGEYQPVKVDGKKYFLNQVGEAFEHRGGKLHPTDAVRGLTQSEVAAQQLKPLPSDMQRTSFQNLGRELTALGALPDGRIILQNSTNGAPMRDTVKVPDNVDPYKGEFKDLQHQRLSGRDYFISGDNKVYTFLEQERLMMEVQSVVVQPAEKVYSATGMPGSSAEERALNKQVNDILEPLRVRIRSGEQVDALTRAEYMTQARDALMPQAKAIAKSLGLPESVITDQTFRFAESESLASHNPKTGEVTLNIFGDSHVTSLDHEIKHKKQSLDKIAAAAADPAGFRDALVDRAINDIGKPGRRFTDVGIDSRPVIQDPKAVEELQKLVRDQVMRDHAERGLIPKNQAPPATPDGEIPSELIKALGNVEAVRQEIAREAHNARSIEKQNTIGKSELNEGSQKYVEQKAAEFKKWKADNGSTADGGALKTNPEVKQMLESVAIDTLGTHQRLDPSLRTYYQFSPTEIDARKHQVDSAIERLTAQLKSEGKSTALAEHPEGKRLIERGQVIELQQQLLKDFQNGDSKAAKGRAAELLQRMEAEPKLYTDDIRFMQERGLLNIDQIAATKFEPLLREQLPIYGGINHGDDVKLAALEHPGVRTPSQDGNWRIGKSPEVDPKTKVPTNETYRAWYENSIRPLAHPEGVDRSKSIANAIADGRIKFSVLDRNALNALNDEHKLFSREGGKEKNSAPYIDKTTGLSRTPLKNAGVYDAATHDQPVIIFRNEVMGKNGIEERYEVVNGNRRIHVFGSETLNAGNKEIPVLVFENAETMRQLTGIAPSSGEPTRFAFEYESDPAKRAKLTDLPENISKKAGYTRTENLSDPGLSERVKQVLNLSPADSAIAEQVIAQAKKYNNPEAPKTFRDGTVLTAAQCLDLAMIETFKTPSGGKMRADSALKKLKDITDIRMDRNTDLDVKQGMEVLRLKEAYDLTTASAIVLLPDSARAEKMYQALGGKASILEANAISAYPAHLADPKLAMEMLQTVRTMKATMTANAWGDSSSRVNAGLNKWLGMALIAKEQGLSSTNPADVMKSSLLYEQHKESFSDLVKPKEYTPPPEVVNQQRFEVPKVEAKPESRTSAKLEAKPGEAFAEQVPSGAKELRNTLYDLLDGKLGTTINDTIPGWMNDLADDAAKSNKWNAEEIAKFREIAEKYRQGDSTTVRQVNDWLDSTATDTAKPSELAPSRARQAPDVPSPVGADRLGYFNEMLPQLQRLEGEQFSTKVTGAVKETLSPSVNRENRATFEDTKMSISENSNLKAGESELVLRHGADVIKPISFQGGENPVYITADGTKIPASEVSAEVKVGAGSSKAQIARETLVRAHELSDLFENKIKQAAVAQSEISAIRRDFDRSTTPGDTQIAGRAISDNVVTEAQFEFRARRKSVELSKTGVKIGGGEEIPYERLVKRTTEVKKAELERLRKEKLTSTDVELEGRINVLAKQVAELEKVGQEIRNPESLGALMEAIKDGIPGEVAKAKAEGRRPGSRLTTEAIGKAGAYALVLSFLASHLVESASAATPTAPLYAPLESSGKRN